MKSFNLSDIAHVLNAELIGKNCLILSIITDTRVQLVKKKSLFVALKGKHFDAHDFIMEYIPKGVSALLVNRRLSLNISQLIVADTCIALGQLGSWVRNHIKARVIAITGTSGKTSVKEMTTSILAQCGSVLSTESNFNNKIGVSLTLLNLKDSHNFAVIELGASHIGEIAYAVNLVQPEVVLVNNISEAHLSGFGSLYGISQAKGEIFSCLPKNGLGVINNDSNDWLNWQKFLIKKSVYRFSLYKNKSADFFASNIISNCQGVSFVLHSPQGNCQIRLLTLGYHNIANALAASALSMSVGATLSDIAMGLSKVKPLPGRLFPISLDNNKIILDDSYNSSIISVISSVRVLSEMPGYRVIVISEMAELGGVSDRYHQQVTDFIVQADLDKVLTFGKLKYFFNEKYHKSKHLKNKSSLVFYLLDLLLEYKVITILVKGSRNSKMEQIVKDLQEKYNVAMVSRIFN